MPSATMTQVILRATDTWAPVFVGVANTAINANARTIDGMASKTLNPIVMNVSSLPLK